MSSYTVYILSYLHLSLKFYWCISSLCCSVPLYVPHCPLAAIFHLSLMACTESYLGLDAASYKFTLLLLLKQTHYQWRSLHNAQATNKSDRSGDVIKLRMQIFFPSYIWHQNATWISRLYSITYNNSGEPPQTPITFHTHHTLNTTQDGQVCNSCW